MNIKAYIKNPFRIFYRFNYCKASHLLSDKALIKLIFRARMGYKLNLDNLKTFNEKLQWLKLYDRRPEYTTMVDKLAAKDYVADILGDQFIIPTLGVWDSFDEINFDSLPNQFVLKCTHNCGDVVICKDKELFDKSAAREITEKSLKTDFYKRSREWPYKNVSRKVFAEKYLEDSETGEARDYKFFCFNGKPDCVMVCIDRQSPSGAKFYFFDSNWKLKRYNVRGKNAPAGFTMPKPSCMDDMFGLAEKLAVSTKAPFVRVDFYEINGQAYFGELTFYPDSGFDSNILPETDNRFGTMIKLTD